MQHINRYSSFNSQVGSLHEEKSSDPAISAETERFANCRPTKGKKSLKKARKIT